ncbi:Transcriptional regulator, ArsR family [Candidatus Rhodobacter oscarellae]|uniref:Transcriptional regulator, ArsR family n=1 Tax=Candidatus Rhodobacter oscarellae TaxID=1675527 RepID=A0A0J9EFI4_9RHOB|nr:winged helix-turn-helix domain-containing protein [Candidatus Rhodobacter lobularis]KMW60434.1 Transcriptional regulator, ArsR family [Candidatus Rhodobacter lobularis]
MREGPDIARVAALIGDPARANMLTALMSGRALTATELAAEAGVTLQTASGHLAKLSEGDLLRGRKQGRHKYFAIASDEVAAVLEALMGLAAGSGHLRTRLGPRDTALREARVCYNHLAGTMGIAMFDAMISEGQIATQKDQISLTAKGHAFAESFGIKMSELEATRAPMCRECLDWSERRSHLAGKLGRAYLSAFLDLGWATRDANSRAVHFSPKGRAEFSRTFAVTT